MSRGHETIPGHRLYDRGLSDALWLAEVLNSSWIAQMELEASSHPNYDPARPSNLKHYILQFHDSVFECVADGYRIATTNAPMDAVLQHLLPLVSPTAGRLENVAELVP